MIKKDTTILMVLVCIFLFCVGPASAAINTIAQGNVVFIGEQALDITLAMGPDTQIGWWASAANISSSAPTKTIELSSRTINFMVSPSEFSGYLGNWYRLNGAGKADGIAFSVADPELAIQVEDTTTSVDVEKLNWIPTGDDIRFRIDTNLVQMASQRSTPPLITIKVLSPDGASYTSLYNADGIPASITEIPVTTSPFYTGSLWNMGNLGRYHPGTYTIWAECNVNSMRDNYDVTGKTVSSRFSLLNQAQNPLIGTNTPQVTTQPAAGITTVVPAKTTVITGQPTAVTTITTIPVPSTAPPSPAPTQTPGFAATLAGAALLTGLVCSLKKE